MSKKLKIFMLLMSLGLFIVSCSKKPENPFIPEGESLSGYHTETAKVDYGGENNVAFFDFSSGTITHIKHDVWDIAFATYDSTLMIANSGSYGFGVTVTNTKSTNWLADYSGEAGNINQHTTIDDNPLKDFQSGGVSKRYVYLAKDEAGNCYKFQIDSISGSTYKLRIDTLDGNSTSTIDVTIDNNYDYIYVDLGTKSVVSFAPPKSDWDIKFGRTEEYIGGPMGWVGRSSVSVNIASSVKSALVEKNIEDVKSASGLTLSPDLLNIGHNWYTYNHATHTYSVDPQKTWIIQTVEGNYAKFQMLTFYGPNKEKFYSEFKFYYQDGGSTEFEH